MDITQFWSWFTPGLWAISVAFESIVLLKREALFTSKEEPVRGYAVVQAMAATDGEWQRTMQQDVGDLIEKLRAKIPRPEEVKFQLARCAGYRDGSATGIHNRGISLHSSTPKISKRVEPPHPNISSALESRQ